MPLPGSKLYLLAIEGTTSFAATCFGYYFYFLTKTQFGFDDRQNLVLAAGMGLAYALFSWLGGKIAHRFGCIPIIRAGLALATTALALGATTREFTPALAVLIIATLGFCLIFPAIEAALALGESGANIQRLIGLYNIVWSATGAVAYFLGGTVLEKLGPHALFWAPALILALGLGISVLARQAPDTPVQYQPPNKPTGPRQDGDPPPTARIFLHMAWVANPFAYVAINTLVAITPGIAQRLHLSPMLAGYLCSVWFFARVFSFLLFMHWNGWHYRFSWLVCTYVCMIGAFTGIACAPNLAVLLLAQTVFGLSVGLIYYSSLFYSMHVGEAKAEHGGIHEAAIGLGNFAGPATGALFLHLAPTNPYAGVTAVAALLATGLLILTTIWKHGRRNH